MPRFSRTSVENLTELRAPEFAAARIDAFGVRGLAAHLDDRLRLLSLGQRTTLPRQRTMRATLDWSYGLLCDAEQTVLRRLAIFPGDFTFQAVGRVAADAAHPESEITDLLAELVAKSLIVADLGHARGSACSRPRVLMPSQSSPRVAKATGFVRRYAKYCRDALEAAAQQDGAADN
jgi:predicted ATPase